MNGTVMAIYENGVLHPLTPIALPERARVQIRVERVVAPTDTIEHRRRVREALVAGELSLPIPSLPTSSSPISAERREELAHLFAAGRPLSELIVEEREGRLGCTPVCRYAVPDVLGSRRPFAGSGAGGGPDDR